MKPTLHIITSILLFLFATIVNGQSCNGTAFTPPADPSNCAYTYTGTGLTGWKNAAGNDTAPPPVKGSLLTISTNICILANLSYNFAILKDMTFYVAPGVTFTGDADQIKCTLIIRGTAVFATTPTTGGTKLWIYPSGSVTLPNTFSVSSNDVVHNAGILNIGKVNTSPTPNVIADLNVSSTFWSYSDSKTVVTGAANISGTYNNCGLLEVYGHVYTQGSSQFNNYCSTYLHGDMKILGGYTNVGLMYFEGQVDLTGPTIFYNSGILIFNNLILNNDDIVGLGNRSAIITRGTATLTGGASITNSYFFNASASPPPGGGFNSVCGTCTLTDVNILIQSYVPPTVALILANCGANISIDGPFPIATLDFDGVDDYLTTAKFINGLSNVTVMAWVKSDTGNSTNMTIAGEDTGCKLWLQNGNKPSFTIKAAGVAEKTITAPSNIIFEEWHHVTGSYNSTTGIAQLYVDGSLVSSASVGATAKVIENTASSNNSFEIGRRSSNVVNKEYFKGDIDEVRVFNLALTDSQIQRMVYQEIQNTSGLVRGKVIAKDIVDVTTNVTVPWANLLAYYPMTDIISYERTLDYSSNNRKTYLKNITTIQAQTAPMPYVSKANGAWTSESTWLDGNVWDIENTATNKDWSIVKISNQVTACHSVKTLGLIVDTGATFTVHSDNLLQNSWFLGLNGTIDLLDDSQLIQTTTSDLVTSATGKILRRQEGTSNAYRYNYWASPVGITSVTNLSNNNAATNNANNLGFKLNMLKDQSGINMQFTSAYNQVNRISNYWLYTFKNGKTYWDWAFLNPTTTLETGVGYTQKGTGNAGTEQQYIFEGKPNNGTILINVTDTGGPGSVPNVSKTEYLLGNPYPSALDVHKFIDDNVGVTGGTLELWQQWAGDSHNLNQYQGGYAQVNKTGSVRAYQFVGKYGANNGQQNGTKTPSRYLPVGQGFITEIIANGTVKFNNSQRIFIKEADANGTYNTGSTFFKSTNTKSKGTSTTTSEEEASVMQKIRLEFSSVAGPETRRELLLGFSDETTDAFDYGYEAECGDTSNNDFNLSLDGKSLNIQAYSAITEEKVIPMNFKSSGNNSFEIKATEFENLEAKQDVYLRDNLTGKYFDLTKGNSYRFSSEQGIFNNRFEMVFQSASMAEAKLLGIEEAIPNDVFIYYQNSSNTLFGKKLNTSVDKLSIINMRGQSVLEFNNVSQETLNNGLKISNVATGAYVAWFKTQTGQVITKKIIVN